MIYLTAALMVGYALGTFLTKTWKVYVLCLPVSCVQYLATKAALGVLFSDGNLFSEPWFDVEVSVLQAPLLMLGVYLAQRKAGRSAYRM